MTLRNDGSEVPINLDDNSYGYVAVSAYVCGDPDDDDPVSGSLIGNFRILDDTGYEYRTNMIGEQSTKSLSSGGDPFADVVIHVNTVDGANFADVVGFTYINDRTPSGESLANTVTNEENGVTFSNSQALLVICNYL